MLKWNRDRPRSGIWRRAAARAVKCRTMTGYSLQRSIRPVTVWLQRAKMERRAYGIGERAGRQAPRCAILLQLGTRRSVRTENGWPRQAWIQLPGFGMHQRVFLLLRDFSTNGGWTIRS